MDAPRRPARAEVVGSLLRPPALSAAVEAFYERGHSAVLTEEREKDRTALRELEDAAIREVVRRQIDIGLDVVTDGEFRRWMFMNSFYDAGRGVRTGQDRGVPQRARRGRRAGRPRDRRPLEQVDSPAAREAAFMAEATGGYPFKVTFPAPSIFLHPFTTVAGAVRVASRSSRGMRSRSSGSSSRTRSRPAARYDPVRLPALSVPRRPDVGRAVRGAQATPSPTLVDAAIAAEPPCSRASRTT